MKRLLLLLLLALCLPLTARADDASRRDKAKEMLVLLHTDRLFQQLMDGMNQQVKLVTTELRSNQLPADQRARLDSFQQQLFAMVSSQLSYKSIEPDYIKLYTDNFTDEELDGMLAFYKSPVGKSVIEKLPALTAQSMQLGQTRMLAIMPQFRQLVQSFVRTCPACKTPKMLLAASR